MNRISLYSGLVSLSIILSVQPVTAQAVVSDRSLNTIVTRSGNDFTIDNGTTSGTNLFHSFREFSIPIGGAAIFNNAPNIQNIFSRVTGASVSNIDGLIQTNGSANLFLINPNGILFGANASLNVGGSFVASTAEAIKFADGKEFSAVNSTPLLTISAPVGLQFGLQANAITNRASLQVQPGKTIALIGGNLMLESASLTAPSGRIELGSASPNNLVGLNPDSLTFDYSSVSSFQDIQMQNAIAEVSGTGGTLQLQGRNIQLSQGSQIRNHTTSAGSAGQIGIRASEKLLLSGPTTRITTELLSGTTNAQGAHISIASPTL